MDPPAHTYSVKFGDNNSDSGNISGSFNSSSTVIVNPPDEESELLRWLSPLESQDKHQDVRADRFDCIGDWLLHTNEFQEWRRGGEAGAGRAVLFCSGKPGVGKTYLR